MPASDLFDVFDRFFDRILHGMDQDERPTLNDLHQKVKE
jgi:hypothetical protein